MTTLQPFGCRILVRPDEAPSKVGTIHIPDKVQKAPSRGTILAIGRGDYDQDTRLLADLCWTDGQSVIPPVGARIVYSHFSGMDVKVNGEDLILLHIKDCLAIVHEDANVESD